MIRLQTINNFFTLMGIGFTVATTIEKVTQLIDLLSPERHSFLEILVFVCYLIVAPTLTYVAIQVFFQLIERISKYDRK